MTTTSHFEEHKLVTEFKRKRYIHTITDLEEGIRYETWVRIKTLGKGSEGTVYKETCLEGRGVRAVKQIRKSTTGAKRNEMGILIQLRAYPEHFVQLTGWFEDINHIYLAMEYLPGNLGTLLNNRNLSESEVKSITKQILMGLDIMHKMNICHRDLKPSNILIAQWIPVSIKIADFGISKHFDSTECRTTVGTNSFMAPEVWGFGDQVTSVYTTAVDIWSLGCLLCFMITKALPFPETKSLERFVQGRIPFPLITSTARPIPPSAIELITSMLQPLPQNRVPASKAQLHSWLLVNEPPRDPGQPTTRRPAPASAEPKMAPPETSSPNKEHRLSDLEVIGTSPHLDTRPKQQRQAAALVRGRESIQYLLVAAASSGDCKRLMEALRKGAKPMENPTESGYPPIYLAAKNGHLPVIKLLFTNGAHLGVEGKHEVSALHGAAEAGNLQIAKYLLDNGADISAVEKEGRMAHHIAAQFGATEALQLLVERGADISARQASGDQWTALMYAAWKDRSNAARYLLDRGADISAVEQGGRMAHHIAAENGATEVLQLLVERGADISARDTSDHSWTALMYAAWKDRSNAARYLLDRGADISEVDGKGYMAHHIAAECGATEVLQLLVERGADISAREASGNQWTALMYAAWKDRSNAARYVLDRGADISAVDKGGRMAHHIAAENGATEVLQLLVERGADISAPDASEDLWTALMYAAQSGHFNAARYLLDRGADISAVDKGGRMAHHIAAQFGATEVLQLLVERGADISARDTSDHSWTALMYAAWKDRSNAARYLLDRGADISAVDKGGRMAHHIAAENGATEVLQLLVERGADISARDTSDHSWTALMYAAWKDRSNAARYLLDRGADISEVDGKGYMAHHIAAECGATEVLQLLVERGADISAREASGNQWTALMYAAWKDRSNAARYLLDRGADISAVEQGGRMAHHIAAQFGATEVLQLLVERGADISAPDASEDLWTALMYAAQSGHLNAARYLLERGASISVAPAGKTAMSLAAEEGHIKVVLLLSDWNERDTNITFTEHENPRLSTEDSTQTTSEDESITSSDSRASPSESLFSTHLKHLDTTSETIWE